MPIASSSISSRSCCAPEKTSICTVQDLEAANEELKSSNEELLSMNEELQSANEELETSKEETQAANEALWAANLDLGNHLRSIRIATIFLDRHGSIRGFTPPAGEIYHLVTADVGRPLSHFSHLLVDPPPLPDPDFDRAGAGRGGGANARWALAHAPRSFLSRQERRGRRPRRDLPRCDAAPA